MTVVSAMQGSQGAEQIFVIGGSLVGRPLVEGGCGVVYSSSVIVDIDVTGGCMPRRRELATCVVQGNWVEAIALGLSVLSSLAVGLTVLTENLQYFLGAMQFA